MMVERSVSCEAGGSCWSCAGQKVVECLVGADKPITNLWAAGTARVEEHSVVGRTAAKAK